MNLASQYGMLLFSCLHLECFVIFYIIQCHFLVFVPYLIHCTFADFSSATFKGDPPPHIYQTTHYSAHIINCVFKSRVICEEKPQIAGYFIIFFTEYV